MKKILKIYGLPRTGTNALYWLLTLNFKNYTCDLSEFGVDYLGWKHGVPPSEDVIKAIVKQTQEQILFVFTKREYQSWKEAVLTKHQGTWEFPSRFKSEDCFFYNTPNGFEVHKDIEEFYNNKQNVYDEFALKRPETSIIINFEDLQKDQIQVVQKIKDKFDLDLSNNFITPITKRINCSGHWEDLIQ